ncbi:serine/threonine protein kinase [Archangium sp.]|uniref:serine/threonine protein kinase n=1 Tax=Archangium sp. TaxID=1872627 RepID=UPI002D2C5DC5|nr:protein kinase [Archangium sp.]HYO53655.1 protein kinase [Archangium sp.]
MSFLYELPPVRRFRLLFTRRRAFFRLGGGVYEALRFLGYRDTREELLLARREGVQGPESLCVIERLHRPGDSRLRQVLAWELAQALHLRHPGLLRLRRIAAHGEGLYAVHEYLGGWPLDAVLRLSPLVEHRALPVGAACQVAAEVAEALHCLHTRADARGRPWNLAHRDVSPSFIWLSPDGRVKLTGFGTWASRQVARVTFRRAWRELFRDCLHRVPRWEVPRSPHGREDLHSLGVVLLEMLRGRPLWDALSPEGWKWGLSLEEVHGSLRWLQLPHGLRELLLDALGCGPSERPMTAAGFRDALRQYACGQSGLARALLELEAEASSRLVPWDVPRAVLDAPGEVSPPSPWGRIFDLGKVVRFDGKPDLR